jgi:predicted Zn-dependent protease
MKVQKRPIELNYHLARTKLRVATSTNLNDTLKAFEQNLKTGSYLNHEAEMYGYALVLIEKTKYEEATKIVNLLYKSKPNSIAFKLLRAQLTYKSGNSKLALKQLQEALQVYPSNPTLTESYVSLLLKLNKPKQARDILRTFLREPPPNPRFYKLLSNAENKLKNKIGSHEALARYYYHMGFTHSAIEQVTLALKDKDIDFYTSSRLESRLKEMRQEVVQIEQANSH